MILPMFPKAREKMIFWNLDKTYLLRTQEQEDTFCHKPEILKETSQHKEKCFLLQHILQGRDDRVFLIEVNNLILR